jgi:Tetratricopeptide repeat
VTDNPRILELRRRVEADPSSIAFAQLAEEYRRSGNLEAAEQVCRQGLARHPGYLSARVTLGCTLLERGDLDAAMQELQCVLDRAPDNLAAIRGIGEIHRRRGELEKALQYYRRAVPLARHDPELEETVNQINRELGAIKTPAAANPVTLSFEAAQNERMNAVLRLAEAAPAKALAQTPMVFAPPALAGSLVESASPVNLGPPVNIEPQAGVAPPAADVAPPLDLGALTSIVSPPLESSPASAPAAQPAPEPKPEPQIAVSAVAAPIVPGDDEARIDFDELLKVLGRTDQSAPPQVEALLTREQSGTTGAEGASGAEDTMRFGGPISAPDAPEHRTEPSAPVAPIAPEDATVLAELEAWLAALKR